MSVQFVGHIDFEQLRSIIVFEMSNLEYIYVFVEQTHRPILMLEPVGVCYYI